MLRRFAVYPVLFVIYIIVSPLVANFGLFDPVQAVRPLVFLFSITLLSIVILYAIFKDWQYAGYFTFLVLVFFFAFGHISRLLQAWLPNHPDLNQPVYLLLWAVLLVALSIRLFWRRLGCASWVSLLLTITMLVALINQVAVGFARILPEDEGQPQLTQPLASQVPNGPIRLDCTEKPDIYHIFLDGYGRQDILETLYGVDQTGFLTYLAGKGFYTAQQSHANYTQTIYSIPSALSFDYPQPEPVGVTGSTHFLQLMVDNRIMQLLEQCGYKTIALESGFFYTDHMQTDLILSEGIGLSEFENLLLANTPFEVLVQAFNLKVVENSHPGHRSRVLNSFKNLAAISSMEESTYTFAHIISPHPPFVFDPQGNPIDPPRGYVIADGSNFAGGWDEYRRGYAAQVQFINSQLEQTVDAILSRSETPPIIIIQGDHGPGGSLDWDSPERSCLAERTQILNTYYLPAGGASALYPTITPVNTYRVILNAYFGAELPLLPDNTYFTSHNLPRQVIDITAERDSTQNCPTP